MAATARAALRCARARRAAHVRPRRRELGERRHSDCERRALADRTLHLQSVRMCVLGTNTTEVRSTPLRCLFAPLSCMTAREAQPCV
eukprot:157539-Prymnesium_polylepis.1